MLKKRVFHALLIVIFVIFCLPSHVQTCLGSSSVDVVKHGPGDVHVDQTTHHHHHYHYHLPNTAKRDSSSQTDDKQQSFITETHNPKTTLCFSSKFFRLFRRAPSPRILPLEETLKKPQSSSSIQSTAISTTLKSEGSNSTLNLSSMSPLNVSGGLATPRKPGGLPKAGTNKTRRSLSQMRETVCDESKQARAACVENILLQLENLTETSLETLVKQAHTKFDTQHLNEALVWLHANTYSIDEIKTQLREVYQAHMAKLA